MHTDQILNDPLGSGKPEFSQTQPGHDLGVSMDHRPLSPCAVWTQLLSLSQAGERPLLDGCKPCCGRLGQGQKIVAGHFHLFISILTCEYLLISCV